VEYALNGIKEYGLFKRKVWDKALQKTNPGRPLLVQRLDRLDSFYYIVPMQESERRVPVLVNVDARFGYYRQALAIPDGSMDFVANIDRKAILKTVVSRKFELEGHLGRLLVRREALCLYPTLVWRPCRESLSPYWPFHMFTIAAHRLYIRIDGAVFTELHDNEPGI
jgi:hypothetical protein